MGAGGGGSDWLPSRLHPNQGCSDRGVCADWKSNPQHMGPGDTAPTTATSAKTRGHGSDNRHISQDKLQILDENFFPVAQRKSF